MKSIYYDPKKSAIVSALLSLPFIILVLSLLFGIKPNLGPFTPYYHQHNSRLVSLGILGLFTLLMVGFAISFLSLKHSPKTGHVEKWKRINIFLFIFYFLVIAVVIIAIVLDQYPCWIGMPNCD